MIEATVLEYLNNNLDGVPVLMEVPEVPSEAYDTMPERFVIIEKTGESITNRVRTASIALQSYSLNSMYEAASLDETVRACMDDMAVNTDVSSCRMASNYNFTDTRTKRYRYQCVYTISYT